jgi:hypothetical protein
MLADLLMPVQVTEAVTLGIITCPSLAYRVSIAEFCCFKAKATGSWAFNMSHWTS